jgi:predicted Fe-Mo cluster-binding NifX family protein
MLPRFSWESPHVKVAIPRFGEVVAPCFEYSATIAIFTVDRKRILDEQDFCLQSREALDRVRLLRDQGVDTLICGGVHSVFEDMLEENRIQVISWVSGEVDELIRQFLRGGLTPGSGQLCERAWTGERRES